MGKKKPTKQNSFNSHDQNESDDLSTPSGSDNVMKTTPSKAEKRGSGSNSFIWFIFLVVTFGLSFGFKTIMDENNNEVNEQISKLQNEISTMTNSQADLKAVASLSESVSQMEKSINSLKQKMKDLSISLQSYETSASDVMTSVVTLETSNADLQEKVENLASSSVQKLETIEMLGQSMLTLEDKVRQTSGKYSNVETSVAGLSEEILQLSSSSESQLDKISSLESNLATLSASVSKVDSQVKHMGQKSDTRFANLEKSRKEFEDGISEKTLLLERKTNDQMSDMLTKVQDSQMLSDNLRTELGDGFRDLKRDLERANKLNQQEREQHEQTSKKATERLDGIDLLLENMQSDTKDSGVQTDVEKVRVAVDGLSSKFNQLEQTMKHHETKAEAHYDIVLKKLKDSNEETSLLKSDVSTLSATLKAKVESQGDQLA